MNPGVVPAGLPSGLRSRSIGHFLRGLRLVFQPGKSEGLNAVFHFTFTGMAQRRLLVNAPLWTAVETLDVLIATAGLSWHNADCPQRRTASDSNCTPSRSASPPSSKRSVKGRLGDDSSGRGEALAITDAEQAPSGYRI